MSVQTPPRTMIVGYDGTDASRSALKEAVRLAGPDDRVEVIYVYEPVSAIMGRPFYDQALRERQYAGRQVLREATELVAGADATLSFEMHEGATADVLARLARLRDADRIVVGTRRLGRMRAALHSVSQRLARKSAQPVLAVPAGSRHPEA